VQAVVAGRATARYPYTLASSTIAAHRGRINSGQVEGDRVITEKEDVRRKGFWKRHLDKIGVGGSLFAALCCLGFPALVSILSAIGLGFLINDDILRPLLIVFSLIAILGLALGLRHHGRPWALIVGILSAVTTYVFIYVSFNEVIAWLGIAGLVIASLLNVFLRQKQLKKNSKMTAVS
jgi:mercuric ion transport protein